MSLGIVPPIVNRNPRFAPPSWELEAEIDDLAEVVQAAERFGYEFCCFPNHVGIPAEAEATRGAIYWDPATTMGYVAARTSRIKLATYCIVLGYYHPLQIAKTYGTLDRISGGRLILGVGVGSLEPEFKLLGRPFDDRGARADDALRALRAGLGARVPAYHGEYYDFEGFVVDPHAVQERVPIWIGGRTERSLRRALELGDAWAPFGLTLDKLAPIIEARRDEIGARGLDLVLPPEPPLDPVGKPDVAAEVARSYAALGATKLNLRFHHESRAHYIEQLEAMVGCAEVAVG
ncbi:MAG: TIGR03619 family F420-dependent LLM class oxidoreductase [Actinomycetota bacterium]